MMKKIKKKIMISIIIGALIGITPIFNAAAISSNDSYEIEQYKKDIQPPIFPVPIVNYTPENPWINEIITFDASESYHPDNDPEVEEYIVEFLWDLDDDGEFDDKNGEIITHSWATEGSHHISLKVIGNTGLNNTLDMLIFVYRNTSLNLDEISFSNGKMTFTVQNTGFGTCEMNWKVNVTGGLLDYISLDETGMTILEPTEEIRITTDDDVFGFGLVNIIIEVDALNADAVSFQTTGFVIGSMAIIF